MPVPLTQPVNYTRLAKPRFGAPVKWGHPLADGLIFMPIFHKTGAYDAVSGVAGSLNASDASWNNAAWPLGACLASTGASSGSGATFTVPTTSQFPTSPARISLIVWASATAFKSYTQMFGTADELIMVQVDATSGVWRLYLNNNNSLTTTSGYKFDGKLHMYCATCDTSGSANLYTDGVDRTSSTVTAVPTLTNANWHLADLSWQSSAIKVGHAAAYTRILAPSEVRALYYNPFAVF